MDMLRSYPWQIILKYGGIKLGIGYILGCLLSILLWKVDRQAIFAKINTKLYCATKNRAGLYIVYVSLVAVLMYLNFHIKSNEIYNFVTAFVVIDISCTERKNLNRKEKVRFYDTISTISRAIVCGFSAPLLYIFLLGNMYGIVYMIIYNAALSIGEKNLFIMVNNILNIVPCLCIEILLYIIYSIRNKKLLVDFKGDYIPNVVVRPMLNIDIMAAYLERVNFYYYYSNKNTDYMKSYGSYNKKIDEKCIKDYLGIAYGICLIVFIVYFVATMI